MKKIFVGMLVIVIIVLFIWLQINFFNYFGLFGVIPNAGIILITIISLSAGKNIGAITGVVYGLLYDSCFGTSFGIYTLLFGLMGYCVGLIKGEISHDNKISVFFIISISTVFIEIAYLIIIFLKHADMDFSLIYILKVVLLEAIYNVFITFVLYKPLMLLGDIINRSRRAYYEL